MLKEKYVTYSQLNQFLKENSNTFSISSLIDEAKIYFENNNMYKERENLYPENSWVLDMPDEEFEVYCEKLSINLDNVTLENFEALNYSLIKAGYKCYLYRYLTCLPKIIHEHSFFEVCYVWKGSCTQHCKEATYNLEKGDFLIIPPGVKHHIETNDKESIIFNLVIPKDLFHTTLFDVLLQNHPVSFLIRNCLFNKTTARCMLINTTNEYNALGEKRMIKMLTYEFYQIAPNHGMMANASLCLLFGIIIGSDSFEFSIGDVEYNDSILEILEHINSNYRTVTLNSLSQFFGYNESYMSRLIKKTTGMNFSQLIRAIRISHSLQMLKCKDFSLQKISDIIGYSDIGSFVRAFKKEQGIGPKDYREKEGKLLQKDTSDREIAI